MAADTPLPLTLEALLREKDDPYLGQEAFLYSAHSEDGNPTPASLRLLALNSHAAQVCLFADLAAARPSVATDPFACRNLPGVGSVCDNQTFVIVGDVNPEMPMPNVIRLDNDNFDNLVNHTLVPTVAAMPAVWAAADPNANYLPVQVAGEPEVEQVRCRHWVPVPHPYAAGILAAFTAGTLTWRWLWDNVGTAIANDPLQSVNCGLFLTHLRVASALRAQVAAPAPGDPPHRVPETAKVLMPCLTVGTLGAQLMERIRALLPGHRAAAGIGHQLQALAQAQLASNVAQTTQQSLAGAAPTLISKFPAIAKIMMIFSEVDDVQDLPEFFSVDYPALRAASWLTQLEVRAQEIANRLNFPFPILSVPLATDIGNGRISAGGIDNFNRGAGTFRARTCGTEDATERDDQNLAFALMTTGQATSTVDAAQMVLRNNDVPRILHDMDFVSTIRSYYVLLLTVLGPHSRVAIAYRDVLLPQVDDLARIIRQRSHDDVFRRTMYMTVLLYIWRVTEAFFSQIAVTSPHLRASVHAPDYGEIVRAAYIGRLSSLTELPPSLFRIVGPSSANPGNGSVPPAASRPRAAPAATTPPASNAGQNASVNNPGLNPRLRSAWQALNAPSVCRAPGDRYYDASETGDRMRKKVLGDDGNPLCLPHALTGMCYANCRRSARHNALTPNEETRVAASANPPFSL